MIKLREIEEVMKPNFIWDREGLKPMQVKEDYEGNKDLARTIFVGLADMYGFNATDVMNYIDCGYDSYRHKLMQFREYYKIGKKRESLGTLRTYDDAVTKFYVKVGLCLNAIRTTTRRNPYLKIEEYINI
jgi:hypothetical protein